MPKRLAILDPTGRLKAEIAPLADEVGVQLQSIAVGDVVNGVAAILIAPAVAGDLGPAPFDGPPRWVIGDPGNAARVAGAAAGAGASGVLLTPLSVGAIDDRAARSDLADIDLARPRADRDVARRSHRQRRGRCARRRRLHGERLHRVVARRQPDERPPPRPAEPTEIYRAQIATASHHRGRREAR